MSEKFIIKGNQSLKGEIEVLGSKNATGPALSASLLTEESCFISNLPLISDIINFLKILESLGIEINFLKKRKVRLKARKITLSNLDFERISKIRMSVLLIGALLSRFDKFKISRPGGDRIGLRPIFTHIKAFEKLGVKIKGEGGFYLVEKIKDVKNCQIVLDEFSVTATENILLASASKEGKTVIRGAAQEPHVVELCQILIKMGAQIEGVGTHNLVVWGKKKLSGFSHRLPPDYIEAGTFFTLGALAKGKIKIKNFPFSHLHSFLNKMEEIGINFEKKKDYLEVWHSKNLKGVKIQALPFPGFPTDLLPMAIVILTQAKGKSLIHDPLYENRLTFISELKKMGADIEMVDPHRLFIFGPKKLKAVKVESWDIRAGASLLIASLIAEGTSILEGVSQIDRGYEKIEERLNLLGAKIIREKC